MKLMINTAHQRFGGAVQVALSFINECRAFPEHEYFVMLGPGLQILVNEEEFPENFHFEKFDFGPISLRKSFIIHKTMKAREIKYKPDVIISTTGPTYFHSQAPQIIGFNLPLYIYPESPYVQTYSGFRKFKFAIKKRLHYYFFKRDASAFVTPTDDVNQRVRKELGFDKVHTVTNTASTYYNQPESFPNKLDPKSDSLYRFVTISAFYQHKNLELVGDVAKILERRGRKNFEFVLTIKPEEFKHVFEGHLHITTVGPVPPRECPSLYSECDAMFLPTLAECFSASYPEAMIMDKPIITTDLGFARSICGDAALYFKAKDAEAAADHIERLLDDKELESTLIAQGHKELKKFDSPQERAKKYIELCASMAKAKHNLQTPDL
jgi:glycosyltransferase involved in cell wall biosynthesis